jgi:hypothetical protein
MAQDGPWLKPRGPGAAPGVVDSRPALPTIPALLEPPKPNGASPIGAGNPTRGAGPVMLQVLQSPMFTSD